MLKKCVEERILAAINFEEGDRVPIWDYIDNRNIVEHLAPNEPDYNRAMVKVYHTLGIDFCRGYGESYSHENEEQIKKNSEGAITEKISGQTSWKIKYEITNTQELKSYHVPPPPEEAEKKQRINEFQEMQKRFAPDTMYVPGAGCGFHSAYGLMGVAFFSYAMYDHREEIERIIFELNRREVAFAKLFAEKNFCPIYFIGDDIAYKDRLLYSPEFLRQTFIPALRNCCEPLNNAGIKVIFHSDGDVTEILDDMIEAGIAGLNPIEPAAGMDIGLLKRRYGRNLILVGNVDCSQVLPLGSVNDVIAATKLCIQQASSGGGHLIGSSSEITPAIPVENILAFYQTCREFGKYPLQF